MKRGILTALFMCYISIFSVAAIASESLDAESYVETLCNGNAESLTDSYSHTEELLDALKQSGGLTGLQMSLRGLGVLQEAGTPILSEVMGYTSYSVPCIFELQNLNLVINVDAEGKIAGIVTAPYMESVSDSEVVVEDKSIDKETNAGSDTGVEKGFLEIDLSIPVEGRDGWELPGTLTMPEGEGLFPAVILVHGSGPNDRDESVGLNTPFKDIAEGLAKEGIAVYRYDKRTFVYGQEMTSDTDLTFWEETVVDAVKAVEVLAKQEQLDADRIYVAGHSLGGQMLPAIHRALEQDSAVAGYIFLAAPARKMTELMREQYDFLYSLTPKLNETQEQQKNAVYEELDKLKDMDELAEEDVVLGAYPAYWRALEKYDQVTEADAIEQPCLMLQGEEDYQVTMEDFYIWQDTYGEKENWEFKSYSELTHLFMAGEKGNGPADYQKKQTVDTRVLHDMAAFINE